MGRPETDFICEKSSFLIKGLTVACWSYSLKDSVDRSKESTPIIAIHGGPSFCHNYILPLIRLCEYGYKVIFYDQAGCGDSTIVNDLSKNCPFLLTIDYYLEELDALINHYNLESFYIYGSSWGTVLAQEYGVKQSPKLKVIFIYF